MAVDSRLGLEDTIPFGKYKGQTVETVYKENAGYLMWLRDAKAEPETKPDGKVFEPNREFFNVEVLTLLNSTIAANRGRYSKHKVWDDVGQVPESNDTPFEPTVQSKDFYTTWGAF
jgi:hypothetical protein